MHQPFHLHQLVIIDERVDRGIDASPEQVGIITRAAHVVERVGRVGAGTMMRSAHVHRIGTMVDGGDGNVGVTGWRQQLYVGGLGH